MEALLELPMLVPLVDLWNGLLPWVQNLILAVVKATLILGFIGFNALTLIWLERKVAGRIQRRIGPYRVGAPHGFLQTLADGVKLFAKEDVMPRAADKWIWWLAPVAMFIPAIMVFIVIPWGPLWPGEPVVIVRDMNIAVVFVAAVTSFTMLGVFMAGWGSNNKYSLLGAMRAAGQLMGYEVPLVLSTVGVVMLAGSLSLVDIVEAQGNVWYIFPQILAFVVFFIAMIAEMNRTPFDLSEAESELVAGFFTEYSGVRWSFFFFAEYANLFSLSAIATALFLGGWHGPGFLPPILWFLIKTYTLIFVVMWIGWTVPRVRIDQLQEFGWKFLLPLALVNVVLTGAGIHLFT